MVDIKKLYADIMHLMKQKEPYLKVDFSLQKLAKLMDSNTTYVSRAINQGAHQSFPNWLAEFRIKKPYRFSRRTLKFRRLHSVRCLVRRIQL